MTGSGEFEAFVRRFQDMVFATAVRLLGNPTEAEDVAQAVFLRAFQRFPDIRDSPTVAGWLKTTTRNLCLNHLARYRSRWRFFSELAESGAGGALPAHERALVSVATPEVSLGQRELHDQLEEALRALPDHQRVPLVLFHLDEMSYQEIADLLRISLAKVKTDIHRGREGLRKRLVAHAPR